MREENAHTSNELPTYVFNLMMSLFTAKKMMPTGSRVAYKLAGQNGNAVAS